MFNIKIKSKLYKKSTHYTRFVKFMEKHPNAYNLLLENKNRPLKDISLIFFENGIHNRDNLYSISTISGLVRYLNDVSFKGTIIKNNLNENENENN